MKETLIQLARTAVSIARFVCDATVKAIKHIKK